MITWTAAALALPAGGNLAVVIRSHAPVDERDPNQYDPTVQIMRLSEWLSSRECRVALMRPRDPAAECIGMVHAGEDADMMIADLVARHVGDQAAVATSADLSA